MPGTVVAKCLEWNGGGSAVSILVGSGLGDALMVPVYRPDLVFGCAERGAFAHVFRNKECIFFRGGEGISLGGGGVVMVRSGDGCSGWWWLVRGVRVEVYV